jgi:lysozyme
MTTGVRTFGIDVSHHNGKIDWTKALAADAPDKIHFSYAKASQLYNYKGKVIRQHDAQFDNNWAALGAAALPRGAYHYCMPEFSAQEMADLFFSVYAPKSGDLIPALDVEDEYVNAMQGGHATRAQLVAQIVAFGAMVEQKIGRKPLIYIRADITDALGNPADFAAFPLWLANYNYPAPPRIPKPWAAFTLWQYSQSGEWPGVPPASPGQPGHVDFDFLNGGPDALAALQIP